MLKLFKNKDEGLWLIQGFAAGYGYIDDEFAYRVAIHVGVHLVCYGCRVPGWGTDEQIKEVVMTGRDLVVMGWQKNRAWFEHSDLACLFLQA